MSIERRADILVNSVYQMKKIGIALYVLKFILDIGPEHGH